MNKPNNREGFVRNAEPLDDRDDTPTVEIEAQVQEETQGEQWPIKVRLMHRPVRSGANTVKEIEFREPTGGDINRYGNPCHVNQEGEVIILERKMTMMMAALSGILPPFIEAMDPRDWNSCAYRLRGFFLPDPAAWA